MSNMYNQNNYDDSYKNNYYPYYHHFYNYTSNYNYIYYCYYYCHCKDKYHYKGKRHQNKGSKYGNDFIIKEIF